MSNDNAIPCTISFRESFIEFIDAELKTKKLQEKNIENRSEYLQYLVDREMNFSWKDFMIDLFQKTSVSILMIFMMLGFYFAIKEIMFLGFAIGFTVLWFILLYVSLSRHRSRYNGNNSK